MKEEYHTDSFLDGRLQILQAKKGYRFSMDPIILAHHVRVFPGDRVLDLGTGCGILALLLALRHPDATVTGVEIQKSLATIAKENASRNKLNRRIRIINDDMRLLTQEQVLGPVEVVTINPPYYKEESGRINVSSEKAVARHEIHINLEGWLLAARNLLRTCGRIYTIFPAERMAELFFFMEKYQLRPKRVRCVHSTAKEEAKLVIVEAIFAGRSGMVLAPPLFIYDAPSEYSEEASKILRPDLETFLSSSVDSPQKNT
ncbi:tRNA1(Val) (adenine(37)-N6)-methyltransferase [Desulfococcaceae bacterium OttesenSCG-928-F15]|nr:tRNA1(Val) (adenine(37)-N6)-methyltransferase [Desulfococcaceae bacterium OttesenSCG-928-F15]